MPLFNLLLVLLLIMAVVSFPAWPHSSSWGYYPSGGLVSLLVLLVVLRALAFI
jgi:hypothetical protein